MRFNPDPKARKQASCWFSLPSARTSRTSSRACRRSGARALPSTIRAPRDEDSLPRSATRLANAGCRRRRQAPGRGSPCPPGFGRRVMLEQHERGPVPVGELGPDPPGRLGDRGGRRAGLGDHGQVAGLRTGRQPHPEVSNTLPIGDAGRVAPEWFVGDQLAERRQALRRRWRENRSSLPAGWRAETSIASLLLPYLRSILME